jgi:uncharacterized protein (DUF1501 family)
MAHSRRDFLKGSIGALSLSMIAPGFLFGNNGSAFAQSSSSRILVIVQLDGGNDGLNTLVPYTDKIYYAARPTLAVPEASVLKVNDKIGFNPVMTKFKALFDQGKIAVVQNVGYPDPDLSHFRSRVIYHRADPTTQEETQQLGWLGKYADLKLSSSTNPLSVVNFGNSLPKDLVSDKVIAPSINNFSLYQFATDPKYTADRNNQIDAFKKANLIGSEDAQFKYVGDTGIDAFDSSLSLQEGIKKYTPGITYGTDELSRDLQMTAQVIAGNLGTQIFHVQMNGFDTHSQQKEEHEQLLNALSDAFSAFYNDLVRLNKANDVLVLAFSEFGRRVRENGSEGTDHGASCPMFIMGNAVKGGIYGESPSLSNLDSAGNTRFDIDFRSVYSTVLSDWLQTDPTAVLGGRFENIGFINK